MSSAANSYRAESQAEVSPCKGCEHEDKCKNKHPACVMCVNKGVPLEYVERIASGEVSDLEVMAIPVDEVEAYIAKMCRIKGVPFSVLMEGRRDQVTAMLRKAIARGIKDRFELRNTDIANVLRVTQTAIHFMLKEDR